MGREAENDVDDGSWTSGGADVASSFGRRRVVFAREMVDRDLEIFAVDIDGTNELQMTDNNSTPEDSLAISDLRGSIYEIGQVGVPAGWSEATTD